VDGDAIHDAWLDPDVEAHGMREKLVVFATVAAMATGGAATASAMPLSEATGGGPPASQVARDMPADSQAASVAGAASTPVARDMPADSQAASVLRAGSGSVARDMPADSQAASVAAAQPGGASAAGEGSSLPSGETTVILGGVALTILAAGFAAARHRPRPGTA
jgi:hypothetical protein